MIPDIDLDDQELDTFETYQERRALLSQQIQV